MDSQEFLNSHSAVRRSESGSTEVRKERSETKKESMNKVCEARLKECSFFLASSYATI